MPQCNVSRDLKARILYLAYVEGFNVKEIGRLLGIKKSMIYQTLNYYRSYGETYNPNAYMGRSRGCRRMLDDIDVHFIKSILDQEPCLYLDELQDLLLVQHGIHVSMPTLFRTLCRIHFSRKDVSIRALERNNMDRAIYMNKFADLVSDPAMLMFIDKASHNKKNPTCKKGWSLTGRRCFQRRCFVRGKRYSILPVLTLDGIIAHDVIPGSVTSECFVRFLREHVVRKSQLQFLFSQVSFYFIRSHSRTPTQGHGVSLSLITAISIIPRLFGNS